MICVVLKHLDFTQAAQIADVIEFRLDLVPKLDFAALFKLKEKCPVPFIFTLRANSQGGNFKGSEEERLDLIERLARLGPTYMDIEDTVEPDFVLSLKRQNPDLKIILSHHDFTKTPEDLDGLLAHMQRHSANLYKIATFANTSTDALRMLEFTQRAEAPLSAFCMGFNGVCTRVLGPIFGSRWTYTFLKEEEATAPGQISADELVSVYHYRSLHKKTAVYGLIGDAEPVSKSISYFTHNLLMKKFSLNAVYVRMPVMPEEFEPFLALVKRLNFRGLSVTMSLKEKIMEHLDEIDATAEAMGAVNTLVNQGSYLKGYNTDGLGALKAIEEHTPVKGKHIVMLGAGGAAKAVVYALVQAGALVTILNRTPERAQKIAEAVGCEWGSLEAIKNMQYDVIINGTPDPMPIAEQCLKPRTVAMDMKTRPRETEFLEHAHRKECQIVYGYKMFLHQALGQYSLWFGESLISEALMQTLEEACDARSKS